MSFNLFDDMDGLILRERENSLNRQNACSKSSMTDNNASSGGYDGNMPRFPKKYASCHVVCALPAVGRGLFGG